MVLEFLIAWSLFESKCFNGFLRSELLEAFSARIVDNESFKIATISEAAAHFHDRYQDSKLFRNLIHRQSLVRLKGEEKKMATLLEEPLMSLQPKEMVFLISFTVYRFRNNIFDGNKGVLSWLQFKQQIDHCIEAMKASVLMQNRLRQA